MLSAIDVLIVIAYVLGTILIGAWFAGRQRDVNTYFVGGRDIGGWLVLVSVVATETSTVSFLSVPGLGFGGNLTFLQLAIGFIVGRFVVARLLLPSYMNGEFLSAYELLRRRFNPSVQRTASGLFLLTRTLADGLRLFLTALLLKQFVGWDISLSILVMGAATIIYTYLGGMQAVIWTDLIQFVVYMLGALVAVGFILARTDGGWQDFVETGSTADKFAMFDFSWDFSSPFTFWAGLVGGAFLSMASHGADQLTVQRLLCARSLGSARAALLGSGFVVFAQFLLFLLIGIGLYVITKQGALMLPEGIRNDEVFGYFIVHALPIGVVGVLIAAVLSAAMSTLSSSLNSSSNAVVNDFYRPMLPQFGESHYLRVSRLTTTLFGIAQIGVALLAAVALKKNVIEAVLSIAGMTTGMILGLFLLGRMARPVRSAAALVGLLVGFLTVLNIWHGTTLAWPYYAPVGTLVTVIVAILVDRFIRLTYGSTPDRSTEPGLGRAGST